MAARGEPIQIGMIKTLVTLAVMRMTGIIPAVEAIVDEDTKRMARKTTMMITPGEPVRAGIKKMIKTLITLVVGMGMVMTGALPMVVVGMVMVGTITVVVVMIMIGTLAIVVVVVGMVTTGALAIVEEVEELGGRFLLRPLI